MAHLTPCRQIVFTGSTSSRVTFGLVEGERLYKIVEKRGMYCLYKCIEGNYSLISRAYELSQAMTLCRLDNV